MPQSPRVIHRDGFVIRIAVVQAAPILRYALTIRVGGAPGAIGYTADRPGDILLTARLAASETKRGRHKRPGDGSGREVPNPAALFAKRIALSIGQMFHVLRHAITPVPESARFAFKIIGD